MRITRLTPDHVEAYRALMLQAYARHPEAFTSSVAERAALPLDWWTARLAADTDASEMVLGAFVDDTLAGVAGLGFEAREKTRHKATLFGMYVAETARARGVGRQLVDAVLAHARRRPGTLLVQLTVTDGNVPARRLYESRGFIPFGTEPLAVRVGDAYLAKVHMWCGVQPLPQPLQAPSGEAAGGTSSRTA